MSQNIIFENEFSVILLEESSKGLKQIRKINRSSEFTAEKRLRFRNEYACTSKILHKGVRKALKLESVKGLPSLVLEYIEGETLSEGFIKKSKSIEQIIDLFIQVTEILMAIHLEGIIHRDINPGNIIIRSEDLYPVLIDFEKASKFDSHVNMFISFEPGKNNLSYIAPEQTGRVNRRVDSRSDLYSLGITFFEIFAEKLPYISDDPLELIHFHLAKEIPQASHINGQVPEVISRILQKLMAKNAEDRYQTAQGLHADLIKCQTEYTKSRKITIFDLGAEDITGKLNIPQQLYGRYQEIKLMLKSFDKVCNGHTEMLMVAGYSGIGKTALISELYKPVTGKKAFFISGKYQQYQRNSPYFAFIEAITEFCNRLMTESKELLDEWKQLILGSLNEQGKVLTDIIPALEKIIGIQTDVDKLENQESQLRIRLVFQNFIKSIATATHPLVIFCDDLQWADVESLHLIASLLTENKVPYLFLIGAYRDNEVTAGHPLLAMIERVKLENAPIQEFGLKSLKEEHIYELIKDTLQEDDIQIQQLTELVFLKTQGNPFFIIEFLKSIHQNGDLRYDPSLKKWILNLQAINQRNITPNVVDLLISNLHKMDISTQFILSRAACIGTTFDLITLTQFTKQPIEILIKGIEVPILEHYLVPLTGSFEFVEQDEIADTEVLKFRFAHDRIQQACYSLLTDIEKQETHLKIALLLDTNPNSDNLFDLVHHYNNAVPLLMTPEDITKVLSLNLKAAKLASETGSFNTAQLYVNTAQELTTASIWDSHHQMAFELNKLHAELDYLNGDFIASEERLKFTLSKTNGPIDRSKLYFSLTQNYANQAHYEDAISAIREGLKELDFTLPYQHESDAIIPAELNKILTYFNEHGVDSLKSLPFIKEEKGQAIMFLLDNLSPNTYVTGQSNLWTLHVLYKINYTIINGWSYEGFYAFTELSIILNILNMYEYAASCTLLGFNMAELHKQGSMRHYGRTAHIHLHYGASYFMPVRELVKQTPKFYQICMENGEMVFAGYLSMYSILDQYYWGRDSLSKMTQRIPDGLAFLGRIKHMLAYGSIQAFDLVSAYLENKTLDASPFDNDRLKLSEFMTLHEHNVYALTMLSLNQSEAYLLTGKMEESFAAIMQVEPYSSIMLGMALQDSLYRMLSALIYFDKMYIDIENSSIYEVKVNAIREQFSQWKNINPSTFRHKYHLIEAEWHSYHKDMKSALDHYFLALEGAVKFEYNRDIAHIHLRIAAHWMREDNIIYAVFHYEKALNVLEELGCIRPAQHTISIIQKIVPLYGNTQKSSKAKSGFSDEASYEMMDFKSILKASNTLSEEIVYDILIEKLLKIVNENIGGQRALLITHQKNVWVVTADFDINQQVPLTLLHTPVAKYEDIPQSVIHFMIRSPQIINNSQDSFNKLFEADIYWKNRKYINFVTLPLIHKSNLIGMLYIENDLDGGTFTTQRLETLSMLSAQMAVSLENANLYKHQTALNKAYQKFVPHSFLETLGHKDILDVNLGDCIDEEMTVMFCDIRSYSSIAEGMTAKENFEFINSFLQAMLPAIKKYQGYINHFLGDGFIALFKSNPESAIEASNMMFQNLEALNASRIAEGKASIGFGIGLHTGKVMLGVIGDDDRNDANVLSDAVNLAARLETLTKTFNTSGIISGTTYDIVKNNPYFKFRHLGKVKVKGRKVGLDVYEILTIVPEDIAAKKLETLSLYEVGLQSYYQKNFTEAALNLKKVLDQNPLDLAAKKYLQLSAKYMVDGVEDHWTGEDMME
ncbi:MAG: AAA family ATPase [Saprospiraceae bacterium]|nr:AAA family ATPase [Saprospiraceae bacterium]